MYPCLPTSGNIVAEAKFASQEENMFPNKFRNIFVAETMFRTWFHLFWWRKRHFRTYWGFWRWNYKRQRKYAVSRIHLKNYDISCLTNSSAKSNSLFWYYIKQIMYVFIRAVVRVFSFGERWDVIFNSAIASLNRTFHLSPNENILTIALIKIHYLYNNKPAKTASYRSWFHFTDFWWRLFSGQRCFASTFRISFNIKHSCDCW